MVKQHACAAPVSLERIDLPTLDSQAHCNPPTLFCSVPPPHLKESNSRRLASPARFQYEYATFTLRAYQGGTCLTFGVAMQSTLERRHLPFQTGDGKYYVPSTDGQALSTYEASAVSKYTRDVREVSTGGRHETPPHYPHDAPPPLIQRHRSLNRTLVEPMRVVLPPRPSERSTLLSRVSQRKGLHSCPPSVMSHFGSAFEGRSLTQLECPCRSKA